MKQVSEVLDVETQLLISVGSAVAAGCIPCLETIVGKARAEGIDEKKLRAAARTGQFVKDQPAGHMKAFADDLLGTHLQPASAPASGGCPMDSGETTSSAGDTADEAGSAPSEADCGCGSETIESKPTADETGAASGAGACGCS